ncbi:MAG: glycosyltransferase family 4 protein [candidate division Zixibacteria bacterium]
MSGISVLHIDTGREFRGGQRQVLMMTRELKRLDIAQTIAIPDDSELDRRIDYIPKIKLASKSLLRKILTGKISKTAREKDVNIIHAHDSEAHTIGLRLKSSFPNLKLIVTRRVIFPPSGWLSRKFKYSDKVDKFIAVSNAVAVGLVKVGVDKDRIEVINSSLYINDIKNNDSDWLVPEQIREKCDKFIVTAGALTGEKDFFTAIKAVSEAEKRIPGIGLLILGEGPERSKLEKYVAESNAKNIFLMGHIEPMAPVFKKCELFLLTSKSEGLNNSAVEAEACGLPLVVSNVGGLPEIVSNGVNGLLCDAGDYKSFADAIVKILSDELIRIRMHMKSLEISDKFDIVENVQKISDMYKRVLAENN